MKNCPGTARLELAALDAQQRVRPDVVAAADGERLARRGEQRVGQAVLGLLSIRSCSETAPRAARVAIAWTAAAAARRAS